MCKSLMSCCMQLQQDEQRMQAGTAIHKQFPKQVSFRLADVVIGKALSW